MITEIHMTTANDKLLGDIGWRLFRNKSSKNLEKEFLNRNVDII